MKKLINFSVYFLMAGMLVTVSSCSEKSARTGWKYNDKKNGGFQVYKDAEQATGPGLIFIEGGTFVMGSMEQDLAFDNDNYERRVSVSSFYMDETEVTNVDYCE